MTPNSMPATAWGKLKDSSYHSLVAHSADVAAVFQGLLNQPQITRALVRLSGYHTIEPSLKDRLSVLAFLHDIGKASVGFQSIAWSEKPVGTPEKKGHCDVMIPLLINQDLGLDWFYQAIHAEKISEWGGADSLCSLLAAMLSHHGKPINNHAYDRANAQNQWVKCGNYDPQATIESIGQRLLWWFPAAFKSDAQPLPESTHFHHFFLGLLALSDWLASDEQFFGEFVQSNEPSYFSDTREKAAYALSSVGLDITRQRENTQVSDNAEELLGVATLRPSQSAIKDIAASEQLVILEDETGAGKTEAALVRFAALYGQGEVDSLYFAVPTRAAAVQLHSRIKTITDRLFTEPFRPEVILAVPGYIKAGDVSGKKEGFQVFWDDEPSPALAAARWSAANAKRYLASQIAVGTVDQAMMSVLQVKHAHMRAACLARSLVVIDEIHASDKYMSVIIKHLVEAHTASGGHLLLMSATLGAEAREEWICSAKHLLAHQGSKGNKPTLDQAIGLAYPLISCADSQNTVAPETTGKTAQKEVTVTPLTSDIGELVKKIMPFARDGAKVLVIRNRVADAVDTLKAIEHEVCSDSPLLFRVEGESTLHHSRFSPGDRKLLDSAVERSLGKHRESGGEIVVGTQTLEQSLDIDADVLFTDLCPMDVLLQRIGRLHRHHRNHRPDLTQTPNVFVMTPHPTDLDSLLKKSVSGLGPKSRVYRDLVVLQATLDQINGNNQWRIPAMNRSLVEQAVHSHVREEILRRKGDEWQQIERNEQGGIIADKQTALNSCIDFDEPLHAKDMVFPLDDKLIMTRLGAANFQLVLEAPFVGPFGEQVSELRISDWMLAEGEVFPPGRVEVRELREPGAVQICFGKTRLHYDRFGLKREEGCIFE